MCIYIASGCVFRPSEECDPPTASLPGTEGATRKSKRGANNQGNCSNVLFSLSIYSSIVYFCAALSYVFIHCHL